MKKNYFFTLLITLLFSAMSYAQVTELYFSKYGEGSSNNKFVEIYNGTNAAISLDGYGIGTASNGSDGSYEFWISFPSGATIAAGDVFVIAHTSADQTILDQADMTYNYMSNGDDGWGLTKGGTFNDADSDGVVDAGEMTGFQVIDWIGDWGVDPGSGWDVAGVSNATKDHTLTRKASVCGPNASWDDARGYDAGPPETTTVGASEWIVGAKDSGWDTLGSFTGCSSDPSISITSPANGTTIAATTSATISVSVVNFVIGNPGDAGVEGHIHWTVQENSGAPVDQPMKYDTNDETITVTPGKSYTVTMTLVDNAHTPINPSVSSSTTFTVALPCDLVIGSVNTTCDAITSGVDTYTGTIAFTGGNTGVTYTITAASGTVGGDDPSNAASGTITVTGLTEGDDVQVTIVGDATSSCNFTRTLYSPTCIAFPIVETFDYAANSVLTDSDNWSTSSNSGDDIMVVAGALANPYSATEFPNPTGNMVSFAGSGKDPYLEFNEQDSGTLYTSFLFSPADMTGIQASGGYFVVLTDAGGGYKARLWVKPDAGDAAKYNIGVSTGGSASNYHSFAYTAGEENFVVLAYDFDNDQIKVWIDPAPADFEAANAPAATLTEAATFTGLGRFLLRQDSANETPQINFDELRIGTTWEQVTPKGATASIADNAIEGFSVFPNPVKNKKLVVKTSSVDNKQVSIYNVLGKKVFSQNFTGMSKELTIGGLTSGIYILKVIEGDKTATKKLVVK